MPDKFLVADIGGTNTRVGLADQAGLIDGATRRYRNAENASFEVVLKDYLEALSPGPLLGACAGAAGPVQLGVAKMTNLDWQIDKNMMARVTGAKVTDVINDLPAQGMALDDLSASCVNEIKPGKTLDGSRLVIGLGTGVNIVPVHRNLNEIFAPSCEAGHAGLPYRADQAELCNWLSTNRDYPSIEHALAGQGVENIYEFHAGLRRPVAEVMQLLQQDDPKAVAAMQDYVALLATVVGDFALMHLPIGGIYLTGGVSRAISPYLERFGFTEIMTDKGRFSELASSFSVTLIQDDYAALKGCARHLRQLVSH